MNPLHVAIVCSMWMPMVLQDRCSVHSPKGNIPKISPSVLVLLPRLRVIFNEAPQFNHKLAPNNPTCLGVPLYSFDWYSVGPTALSHHSRTRTLFIQVQLEPCNFQHTYETPHDGGGVLNLWRRSLTFPCIPTRPEQCRTC